MLHDGSHHYRSSMVVIMNPWINTVYPSTPWKLIYFTSHSFPFHFCLPWIWLLCATRRVSLEKTETLILPVHLVHDPRPLWSPSCSFTLVTLYLFSLLFYILCCVCLLSMSNLCPSIKFCWFSLESWYPWILVHLLLFVQPSQSLVVEEDWLVQVQQNRCVTFLKFRE